MSGANLVWTTAATTNTDIRERDTERSEVSSEQHMRACEPDYGHLQLGLGEISGLGHWSSWSNDKTALMAK